MKKKLITITIIISAILFSIYSYKKYNDYKFENALAESAKVQDSYWDNKYKDIKIKDRYKVVLVMCDGGELSYGLYFKLAAEKLGWQVLMYPNTIKGKESEIVDFDPDFILLSNFVKPDMSLLLKAHRSRKFLVNFLPLKSLRNDMLRIINNRNPYRPQGEMKWLIRNSDAVFAPPHEVDYYRKIFDQLKKPYFNGFSILPLAPATNYAPAEPKNLMLGSVGASDKLRNSDRYKNFLTLLSKDVPIKVYGASHRFLHLPAHVYDGHLMFGMDNINAIRENGIYLLTHGQFHFDSNMPGLRIFEAVAANAVVISDKLPFAIQNFGDNFLYFDHKADAETMHEQVRAHFQWIKENPEKAKAMADRAHKIFLEKFTLEKDLVRMAQMYEFLMERDKGLSRPFIDRD